VKGRQSSSQRNLRNSSVSEELNTGQPAIHTEDQKLSTAPIIQDSSVGPAADVRNSQLLRDSSGGPAADPHNLIIYIHTYQTYKYILTYPNLHIQISTHISISTYTNIYIHIQIYIHKYLRTFTYNFNSTTPFRLIKVFRRSSG